MDKRKEQEARIKTVILNMDSSNKKCADCENENVTFVSINNGTVICSECAEKHKHLSYWISFIKSFNEKWDDYLLKYLKNGGNSRYLKFCKDYKIENIQSIDRYKTKGVEYYRLILKSEVMGFDPPDNINVNSAGEILENIENNYPEFENYSYVKHVDLEKLEKQFEIDKKFNEENNAGIFQTFSGILGNFGKKLNEAKDNIVGKVNEKWNEEGGLMEKMKGMTEGVKNKYYQFMGKPEELNKNDKNVEKNSKENITENQNKNIENISFNDLKELKEQKNKSSKKKLNSSENNKEEKIIIDDKKEEKLDELEKPIKKEDNIINKIEETNENKKEKIEYKSETIDEKIETIQQNEDSNFDEKKNEKNILNEEKIITDNQEKQSKNIENNEQNLSQSKNNESKEIKNKKNEEKNNQNKLDDILNEEIEEENKMPTNTEEIKQKLDDIINEKEEKENNKKENEKKSSNVIKKTQTNESNKISDKEEILKKETLRSVNSEMFLDENQLNEILGDDKEDDL